MAQTFFASYPSLTASANPSVGPNLQPIPGDATLIAGENPSLNLQPLQTDSSGNLLVSLAAEPGAPLAVNLTEVAGAAVSLGQKTSANSIPVVIASDDVVAISATALPLPALASTSTLQSNVQSAPGTPQTVALTVQGNASGVALPISASSLPLPTLASTSTLQSNVQSAPGTPQTVALTVQGNSSGVAMPISATALPLPALAATSTLQTSGGQKTQIVDGSGNVIASTSNALNVNLSSSGATGISTNIAQYGGTSTSLGSKTSAASIPVVIASDQANVSVSQGTASALNATVTGSGSAGSPAAGVVTIQGITNGTAVPVSGTITSTPGSQLANAPIENVYSSTNITTAAYVQLVASTTNTMNNIYIFDSSGQSMIFAIGASGSEVPQLYVQPGGGQYTLNIPSGTRIAYKALTANATSGYLTMSFLK